ncbi:hypothetical protein [Streptomyces graminilatus]|uniref:hypothetical protein n=1 Tax=Streptomyces graminilatus TaxID=1464070 RepID=UPI0006E39C18|nr:hypothetical protein [Streptomyces graminilatus]
MTFPLQPGDSIARPILHTLIGGRLNGRISPSKTTTVISLFSSPGTHDSQYDGWTGQHFHFQGEGRGDRDQSIRQGNRAVAEHALSGRSLRLFAVAPGSQVRYLGAYRLDPDTPYVRVQLPVIGGPAHPPRTGYVFRLLPENGTPAPSGVPVVEPLLAHTAVREHDLAVPFRPRPGEERGRKLTPAEQEAERLLKDYSSYLTQTGHDIRRYAVTPARTLLPLPVDLLDHTANELVACTGSVARARVLAAFGELLDMRRFFDPTPRRVMLAPSMPHPDLVDLCASNDITLVCRDGEGGFTRVEPASTGE